MNINELNTHIEEIEERYSAESVAGRVRILFAGVRKPRGSREHKLALIELQRLTAPLCAVLVPLIAVLLLYFFAGAVKAKETVYTVTYLDPEKIPEIDREFEPEPDPEVRDPMDFRLDMSQLQPLDPEMKPEESAPAVKPVESPRVMPHIAAGPQFTWKDPGGRIARVRETPGKPTDRNVMLALRWLKKNQNADGSWNRNKCAMTGLAVLTFLAHAETPSSSDEFGDTVLRGLQFLMDSQDRGSGLYGHQDGNQYSHPIATYAMCEAYGLTYNPNVKRSAELALGPIIRGQHPTGGWTYRMDPGLDAKTAAYRDDTSYMGWCVQALKAARMARIEVDGLDRAFKKAVCGFEKNAAREGGFGYTGPSSTHGLTSVGVLCMEMLGAGGDSRVRKSLAIMDNWRIGAFDGANKVGGSPQYYFYYATQCKYNQGGKSWERWDAEMVKVYTDAQKIQRGAYRDHLGESHDIGWWENGDAHTDRPVMDTCLAALQLMVYVRYLPTFQEKAFAVEPEVMALVTDPEDIQVEETHGL